MTAEEPDKTRRHLNEAPESKAYSPSCKTCAAGRRMMLLFTNPDLLLTSFS
jgi:hypothetical protein